MPFAGLTMRASRRRCGGAAPPQDRRGLGVVHVPERGGHLDHASSTVHRGLRLEVGHPGAPAGGLLHVVAAGALAGALREAGRAAVASGGGVVGVHDRRLAPRRGAHVITQHEHPAQQPTEQPPTGVHRHQVPPVRGGVQPPHPHPRRGRRIGALRAGGRIAQAVTQPGAGHRGGDGAVAGDPGRFEHRPVDITSTQQGPVGHHQVHLHRLRLPHRPTGEQLQRGVRCDRTHPTTL